MIGDGGGGGGGGAFHYSGDWGCAGGQGLVLPSPASFAPPVLNWKNAHLEQIPFITGLLFNLKGNLEYW